MAAAAAMLGASLLPAFGALAPNTFSQAQTFFDGLFGNGRGKKRKAGNLPPYQALKHRREGGATQTGPMHDPKLLGGINPAALKAATPHTRRSHFAMGLQPFAGPTRGAGERASKYHYFLHYLGKNGSKRRGGTMSGLNVPLSDVPTGPMP